MPGVNILERFFLGKSLGLGCVSELSARQLHEIGGIALIHDGEVFRQSGGRTVTTKKSVRSGVECPAMDALAVASHQPLRTRKHLLRGAPRKREQQNPLRRHSALDEMSDAVDESASLSGSSPRNY